MVGLWGGYGGAIAPHLRGLSPPTLFIRPHFVGGGYGGAIAPHLRGLSPPTLFIRPPLCWGGLWWGYRPPFHSPPTLLGGAIAPHFVRSPHTSFITTIDSVKRHGYLQLFGANRLFFFELDLFFEKHSQSL
jgi:hypothetical protein